MAKAFLTGQQILDEYGRIDYDLIVAVAVRKELQPINPLRNIPITEDDDPCLYCDGGWKSEYDLGASIGSQVTGRLCNADPTIFEVYVCYEWQDEQLANRLRAATFPCDNVAAYAVKYWLVPPGKDQQTGPNARPVVQVLPTLPGTTWDQIRIRIVKNDRFEIERPGYRMEAYYTKELGLGKARVLVPLLKAFGSVGALKKDKVKHISAGNMTNLRDRLSAIFPGVDGDPIPINGAGEYVCQLRIEVSEDEFSEEYYTPDEVQDDGENWEDIMDANKSFCRKPPQR